MDTAQNLILCVICKRRPFKENVATHFTPGCAHVFCNECKIDYLNCAQPYFLDSSIQQLDVDTDLKTKAKVLVYFRCPICVEIFDKTNCDVSRAYNVEPKFETVPKKGIYNHILGRQIGLGAANGSKMVQLCCTNHNSEHRIMKSFCSDCSLPVCDNCPNKKHIKHNIEPLEPVKQKCINNLTTVHERSEQTINQQTIQKEFLRHLKTEQEWLAKKETQEIERHMMDLIDYVKRVGESLIVKVKEHLERQTQVYNKAITLCDYSLNSASKLDKLCHGLRHNTSSTRDATLLINAQAINDRSKSLDHFTTATKTNVVQMQKALQFCPGSAQNPHIGQMVGSLQNTEIQLPTNLEVIAKSDKPKPPQPKWETVPTPDPDNVPKTRSPSLKSNESDIIPSTSVIRPCLALKWEHVISDGFDIDPKAKSNPNLSGAHYLANDTLLVADATGIIAYDKDGTSSYRFNTPQLKDNVTAKRYTERLWPQCITGFGDTYVAFTDRHQMTVYIYTNEGEFKHRMNREIFRTAPFARAEWNKYDASAVFGITVLPHNGYLAISDAIQRYIYILDPEHETIIRRFGGPGESKEHLQKPTFVTVDKGGRILVSDSESNFIKLYDINGTFIGQCNASTEAITYPGQHRFSGIREPGAIIVDPNNGDLIVANNNPNHRLLHLSKRGEYNNTLVVKEGRQTRLGVPFGLARGSEGQLAMTNKHDGSVRVVQLYE